MTDTKNSGNLSDRRKIGANLGRSLTLSEFQFVENISPATYSKLKAAGLAPEETVIALPPNGSRKGFAIKRISPEARLKWHAKLEELRGTEAAKLAEARARDQRVRAGKLAAESVAHVSKHPRRKRMIEHKRKANDRPNND
jgi:hypothetical protein